MIYALKDIIATFDSNRNLELVNQAFANEIIFAQDLSTQHESWTWEIKKKKSSLESGIKCHGFEYS